MSRSATASQFSVGQPATPAEMATALGMLLAEGHARLSSPPAEWFFAPQGPTWSPAGHIRHLIRSTDPLTRAMHLPRLLLGLRFGRRRGPVEGYEALRLRYLAALEAGGTAGRFTPAPEPDPADPLARRAEILADWSRAIIELTAVIPRWPPAALARYQLPHPLLGLLSIHDLLGFTVYHTAHHLRRIVERDSHG